MTMLKAMSSISWNRIVLQCILWCFGLFISGAVHAQVSARIGFSGNVLGTGSILNVCINSNLTFSDSSLNGSNRSWLFKQGMPLQSIQQTVVVSFSNPGVDSVILKAWTGSDTSTTFIRVNVFGALSAGSIGQGQTICSGARPDSLRFLTPSAGGGGSFNYQWQISTDSINFSNIPSANSIPFRPDSLQLSRYFRVIVTSSIGCGSDTSNAVFIRVWDALTSPQISSNQSICFNTSSTLLRTQAATGGNGSFSYQWQRFVSGSWINIQGQTADSLITGNLTQSASYRLQATSDFGCGQRFSDSTRITVFPALNAGVITGNQNICFASRPDTIRFGTNPTGGGNTYNYQWQVSTDSISFSNLVGATSQAFRPDTLQLTRFYRSIVTSTLNCGSDTSNVIKILVYEPYQVGAISGNDTICFNTQPDTLRIVTFPTGGNGIYNYQWLTSTNNVTWSVVSGQTSMNFRPGNLSTNRFYRLLMQSGAGCGNDTSNSVFIKVWADLTSPQISSNQSTCFNTSSTLFRTQAATGGNGSFSYQWQRFVSGAWSDMQGQTTDSLVTGNLTQSTSYRLKATSGYGCGQRFSDSTRITVFSAINAGAITNNQSICFASRPDTIRFGTNPTGGGNTYNYQWQVSTDSNSFSNLVGATSQTFRPDTLQLTRFYRSIVSSTINCGGDTSNVIKILVYEPFQVGTISGNDTICFNTQPDTLRIATFATGGNGIYNYQWLTSTNNVTWSVVSGQTSTSFRPGNLSTNRFYRLLVQSGAGCGSDTSNSVFIKVWADLTSPQISSNQSTCFNTSSTLFRTQAATGGNGSFSYQWQRFVSGAWSDMQGQTTDSLVTGNLTQSTSYRLKATSGYGCGQRFSDSTRITVFSAINAGAITNNQSICFASRPDTIRFSINPTGGDNAYNYQWQVSTDSNSFSNLVGATAQTYIPDTLQQTRFYRNIVSSVLNCGNDTSNIIRVLVYAPFQVGTISGNDTICFNTQPDTIRTLTLPAGGNGDYNYQWLSSTDNSTWSVVSGQTSISFRPGNLTATSFYRLLMQSGAGCGIDTSNSVLVIINPLPDTAQIVGPVVVCRNQSDALYTLVNDSSLYIYQWQAGAGRISSGAFTSRAFIHWGNSAGTDTLRVKQINRITGCTNEMLLPVTIRNETAPEKAAIVNKPNTNILVCSDSTSGTIYQWGWVKRNDSTVTLIPNSDRQYVLLPHYFDSTTNFYFVITTKGSCETTSFMNFSPFIAAFVLANDAHINVYPNPATRGYIKIESHCELINEIQLIDLKGRNVHFVRESFDCQEVLDISQNPPGLYILRIGLLNGMKRHFKIMVQ